MWVLIRQRAGSENVTHCRDPPTTLHISVTTPTVIMIHGPLQHGHYQTPQLVTVSAHEQSNSVFQTPPFIIKETGQSVAREINCSHSIPSYNRILWYKQDEQGALKFLGYLNINSENVEKDMKGKISLDGDGRTHSRLSISDLALNDSGLTDGSGVTQTDILWEKQGDSATIHCNQTKGFQYDQMYWYRQLPGETMKLIVFTRSGNENHDFGDSSKDKFAATKPNAESGTFTVKNLEPEDKGLYFCAGDLEDHKPSKLHFDSPCLTDGSDVTQTDTLWEKQGDSATIHCNQTKGVEYDQMYWYRQLPGETMKLIVFTRSGNENHDFGDSSKDKFEATKPNAESGTFTVKNLEPEDKGLYFCARAGSENVTHCRDPPTTLHISVTTPTVIMIHGPLQHGHYQTPQLVTVSAHEQSNSVFQTPPFIIKETGQSVAGEINCSHSIPNYDRILWYKQDEQGALKLLGNLFVNNANVEDDVKGKISLDGDGRTHSRLSISDLALNDSGLTDGSDVTQTDILWEKQGDSATIHCNQTKGPGYIQMYWYRQLPGETTKLIVFTSAARQDYDFGDTSKDKFAATKPNAESGTFTVKNLEPEDKGLYFCAVPLTATVSSKHLLSSLRKLVNLLPEKSTVLTAYQIMSKYSGLTDGSDVTQTDILWEKQGDSATIHCNQTKGFQYDQMYWYRQLPGETMKLIVFTRTGNENHDFGDSSKDKFAATKPNAESGTFTVKNLEPEDKGLYFCANMDIIILQRGLLTLSVFVLWTSGLTDGSDVTQTDILWEKQGDNATIHCNQTKGGLYLQMYWYRQLPGETMKLIVFTRSGNENHDFGEFKGDKFAATKPNAESGTFTVKNLEPEDKGLYFCAVPLTATVSSKHLLSSLRKLVNLLPEKSTVLTAYQIMTKFSGLTDGSDVTQTDILWEKQGDSATIHCNQTKGPGYIQMYWYRQLPGETTKLIVFTSAARQDYDFGDTSKDKFAATKPNAESGTFTVKNLEPEDKGLYFCANMDIIILQRGLLTLSVFVLWTSGLTDGSGVTQTDILWEKQGDNATIHCNQTKGVDYTQMYWYRQLPGETMKLIVFTRSGNENHDFGDSSKDKFAATKPNAESGTFTVKNLEPEDKGLYFCAGDLEDHKPSKLQFDSPMWVLIRQRAGSENVTHCRDPPTTLHISVTTPTVIMIHGPLQHGHYQTPQLVTVSAHEQSNSVFQTPPFIIKRIGESVFREINCSHSIPNYNQILWYKQDEQGALKLLGYLYVKSATVEDDVKRKISFEGDGLTDGSDVTQTGILWEKQGDSATMHCNQTKGVDYTQMYWYRQLPGETMKLIVFTRSGNENHDFGDFDKDKFAATKPNTESGTFTVKNLEPEDKGLYFCARAGSENVTHCRDPPTTLHISVTTPTVIMIHGPLQHGHYQTPQLVTVSAHEQSNSVFQTPPFIIKETGQSVAGEINCSHSIPNYDRILWYKQEKGALKLLGNLFVNSANVEDDVKGKISFEGDGLTDGSDVTQTDILWEKQGDNATIHCNQTKGGQYIQMYWYRQLPGETMKLIVFTRSGNENHDFGEFKGDKFAATKPNAESGTFTVKNLEPEDKGLYFCAVPLTATVSSKHLLSSLRKLVNLFPEKSTVLTAYQIITKFSGLTDGSDVTQTDILWEKQGDSAIMHCNQTKGFQYNEMYWYRQLPGETMKLIVYTSTASENHDFGEFNNGKFAATKPNAESGTFTVKNLKPEDKGLYFCAGDLEDHKPSKLHFDSPCASHSNSVFQTPPFIIKETGQSVAREINCSHSIPSYNRILWYKQDKQGALKFLGYMNLNSENVEKDVKGKISFDGDGRTHSRLNISDLALNDSGLTDGSDVTQTDILWEKQGDNATIHCNHTKAAQYNQMYWYRQLPGETMKLIVFTSTSKQDHDFGDFNNGKFAATKPNAESGTFTVKNLEPEDKGLYFCAVPLTATVSSKHLLSSLRKLVNLLPEKSTVLTAYQIITEFSGLTDGSDVTQTDILWEKQGDSATIHCNQTKGFQYDQMYWYRQLPGETMKLIVFTRSGNENHDFGDSSKDKFAATKPNAENGTFTVKNLEPEDKGLYFCAGDLEDHKPSKLHFDSPCLTDGSDVTQTDILWEKQGDSATIHCNQTKGVEYDQMYWYRQLPGETMKLIVFTRSGNENHDFGDSSKDKFEATKPNAESGTFTVKNLEPEDKGLYFCAGDLEDHKPSKLHFDSPCASHSNSVFQTPPFIIKETGQSVAREINCSHSIPNYERILWYKQDEQGALIFLGYQNFMITNLEDDVKGKINFDGDGRTHSRLNISDLALNDSGLTDGSDVTQTDILWEKQGDNATIHCNQTKGGQYFEMYWYRQLPGETMKLIVFTSTSKQDHDFGEFNNGKFAATKPNAESGTFTVKNLEPEDKGLYFCAVPLTATVSSKHLLSSLKKLVNLLPEKSTVLTAYQIMSEFSGLTDGSDVTQTDILWEKQGDSATIHCNQTKGFQYDQMYWYRQLPGETMKLIVFTSTTKQDHDFGDFDKDKFAATKPNAESGTFTVKNLEPEDKGLYFCARAGSENVTHCRDPPTTLHISVTTPTVIMIHGPLQHGHYQTPQLVTVSAHGQSNSVFQTPPFIIKETGQSVAGEINCSHSIPNYNQILWYKQDEQGALKLLGYLYVKSATVEDDVKGKISFEGDGLTDGSDVTQTDILWEKQGDSATMHCNQTKGGQYLQMYWYRQLPEETMKLIVFTRSSNEDHDFGDFDKDKFAATKPNAESGTFTVKNLKPEDKGLYFCAGDLEDHKPSKLHFDSPCLTDGSGVTQTDILWEKQGDNATIHCNQTKGTDYIRMYWYRQLPGETMKQIVYTTTTSENHDFGEFNNGKFAATKPDAESGTFTVKNLKPEDKGLYFCAVSKHSDTDTFNS
ncbi:hypothetical protein ABVT39_010125 [Epinephelus coioides]